MQSNERIESLVGVSEENLADVVTDVIDVLRNHIPPPDIARRATEYFEEAQLYRGTHFWKVLAGVFDQVKPLEQQYQQGGVYVSPDREKAHYHAYDWPSRREERFDELQEDVRRLLGSVPGDIAYLANKVLLLGVIVGYSGVQMQPINQGGDVIKLVDPSILVVRAGVERYGENSLEIIRQATGISLPEVDARVKKLIKK